MNHTIKARIAALAEALHQSPHVSHAEDFCAEFVRLIERCRETRLSSMPLPGRRVESNQSIMEQAATIAGFYELAAPPADLVSAYEASLPRLGEWEAIGRKLLASALEVHRFARELWLKEQAKAIEDSPQHHVTN